jgi:hypothetical protein
MTPELAERLTIEQVELAKRARLLLIDIEELKARRKDKTDEYEKVVAEMLDIPQRATEPMLADQPKD